MILKNLKILKIIDFNILKEKKLIEHTQDILLNDNSEKITYFIEERWSVLWNISQSNENISIFKEINGFTI